MARAQTKPWWVWALLLLTLAAQSSAAPDRAAGSEQPGAEADAGVHAPPALGGEVRALRGASNSAKFEGGSS